MKMSKEQIESLIQDVKNKEASNLVHVPYSESTGHLPDFEVHYSILDGVSENFRQGARCDFLYEGDDPVIDGVHMIWPEFLDERGVVVTDKKVRLSKSGNATMWIGMHESRVNFHRPRLKVGTRGFWVVGSRKLATVEVVKILGLFENNS